MDQDLNTSDVRDIHSSRSDEDQSTTPSPTKHVNDRVPPDSADLFEENESEALKENESESIEMQENEESFLESENQTEDVGINEDDSDNLVRNYGLQLPFGRIKKIIKADPELKLVSQDAVFLISKATELFIDVVSEAAYQHTKGTKRKTMAGKDVQACFGEIDALAFLDGAM